MLLPKNRLLQQNETTSDTNSTTPSTNSTTPATNSTASPEGETEGNSGNEEPAGAQPESGDGSTVNPNEKIEETISFNSVLDLVVSN